MSRNFLLTINNPKYDIHHWLELAKASGANTARAQLEEGELGTKHIQCFLSYKSCTTAKSVSKKFPTAHVESARNALHAYEYCGKSDTRIEGPVEFGPLPTPSKHSKGDTKKFNDMCLEIGPEKMVQEGTLHFREYEKIRKAIDHYKLVTEQQETMDTLQHEWHYGPTGTGKSRYVRETYPDAYIKMPNKWWDGYTGQKTVIIEDYQKEHSCLGYHLKIWGDHYPFPAERKGSVLQIRPTKVIVTSNYHPEDIWEDKEGYTKPILRRFKLHHYPAKI